jgi:hypothetical protein
MSIDDLALCQNSWDTVDFTSDVDSVDKGIEVIKNDIHSILGMKKIIFESKYEELVFIILKVVILRISL